MPTRDSLDTTPSFGWRAFSLAGVAPLGFFLAAHLARVASSGSRGQAAFEASLAAARAPHFITLWEVALAASLVWHVAYGVAMATRLVPRRDQSGYPSTMARTLMMTTGLVVVVFMVCHLAEYTAPRILARASAASFYPTLCARMSSTIGGVPWVALGYLLAIAACAYHIAQGLWAACDAWGLRPRGVRSSRALGWGCAALGVALFALGVDATMFFATGSRVLFVQPTSARAQGV